MRISPTMVLSTMRTVDVSITSDLMCPWCWVGLRKLQEAAKITNVQPQIAWKPFMLRPNIPENGMPKTGTPSSRVGQHLKQAGESVGIDFAGLTDRTPNTTLFHATMAMLQDKFDHETVTAFQEAVFLEYFTLGVYPDQNGLFTAAVKLEKPEVHDAVKQLFEDTQRLTRLREQVTQEALEASMRGISGVPSFTFGANKEPAFSGAQPTEIFVRYLEKYAKEQ